MSWGAEIKIEHPDGYATWVEIVEGHTYNLTPMWRLAVEFPETIGTRWFGGKTCAELQPLMLAGLVRIWLGENDFRALDPPNGWGGFDDFIEIYLRFTRLVHQHPTGVIVWNG